LSHRHLYESNKNSKRVVTEEWLERKIENLNIKFKYFLTLSFTFQQRSTLNQYLDNQHIKKVILDFFYPNRKPDNRMRLWFFTEPHSSGALHLHILMEGMDGLSWLRKNNRKITINKRTLFDIVARDFSMDDVMTEALTNHLQRYIRKLGYGKQSIDWKSIGNIQHRLHYVNKSLSSVGFDKWEHLDYENSDLGELKNGRQHQERGLRRETRLLL